MSNKPEITIVIPTYNRDVELLDSITDCLSQTRVKIEILVIDQSESHSKTFQKGLEKLVKDSRLHYYHVTPPSVTAAKNFALQKASTEIVIFIDDDVSIPKDFAWQHLQAHKKNRSVSAVGGRVLQKGFPILDQILCFDEHAVSQGVFTSPKSGFTNAFAGGNVSIKVADALAVGGFDTRYYLNAFREESDMSMKMTRKKQKIYYEPKAVLTHLAAPRGGSRNRVYSDILDTPMFYHNELFFTIRATKKGRRVSALLKKYDEYCSVPSRKLRLKRSLYFMSGLMAAQWRRMFGLQIIAKERL